MKYPTIEEVNKADREQICKWYRQLQSPEAFTQESKVLEKICERFKEFGGFTPELSKKIGW